MELLNLTTKFMGNQSRVIREGYQRVLDGLGFVTSGGSIKEDKKVLNAFNLTEDVGVFNLTKPQTRLAGNATSVDVTKQVTLSNDCYIHGVAFIGGSAMRKTPLLKVTKTGRAVISNCLFYRGDDAGTSSFVEVEDGGTVVFNGCGFVSTGTVVAAVTLGSSPGTNGILFVGGSKSTSVTGYGVPAADVIGCLS